MKKLLLLTNNQVLVSGIEEVGGDIGEPDCKLTKPFLLNQSNQTLSPWLIDFSSQDTFMISSDKILTIAEPSEKLLKKYEELIK
jgi:hypothetical protein